MAQAHIDRIQNEDISVTDISPNRVVCRLSLTQEVVIRKVKGELRICLIDDGKRKTLSGEFLKKLLNVSESLWCICTFVES